METFTFDGQMYSIDKAPPNAIHVKSGRSAKSIRIEEKVNNRTATKAELYLEIDRLKHAKINEFFDQIYQDFTIDFYTALHLLHNS